MAYDVSVAVLGGWLRGWKSPVAEQGFDVPYADRMKVVLNVEDDESLESVDRRAIDAIQPRAVPLADGTVPDPLDAVYWVWFYEPLTKRMLLTSTTRLRVTSSASAPTA